MPNSVTEIAEAKINLALHVLGRRADGYHELDSIVAFAGIGDELVITISDELLLTCEGMFGGQVPSGAENIILKAWQHLSKLFAAKALALPNVHVALTKNLPVASGIGGGSADAAAMLRGLLRLTHQTLAEPEITALAKSLGADVPVCFRKTACQMQGIPAHHRASPCHRVDQSACGVLNGQCIHQARPYARPIASYTARTPFPQRLAQ